MENIEQKVEQLDLTGAIYASELTGSDETGDGSEAKPFKTVAKALKQSGDVENFSKILVDAKDQTKGKYELVSKTALKKTRNYLETEAKKDASRLAKEAEDAQRREKNLEEAKKVVIKQDPNLPEAPLCKIKEIATTGGQRIHVFGWVHRLRRQG